MSTSAKPTVVVISGGGNTGLSILKGLARTEAWKLVTTVRPASIDKPEVANLRSIGVEVVPLDWQTASPEKLKELFTGAQTVISTVFFANDIILDQKKLADAAKEAGVQRFIPCDFGSPAPPGVMKLHDDKVVIQEYVKKIGVPHTIIDVGIWYQASIPPPMSDKSYVADFLRQFWGTGEKKCALINREHIGNWVARIIADPRTLNKHVYVYEDELTLSEMFDLAGRASGVDFLGNAEKVSAEEIVRRSTSPEFHQTSYEYMNSLYVRGDNSLEEVKKLDLLIGNELYPDQEIQSAAEWLKELYATSA